jgi:cell wall-associated NlpC family hydrolase
VSKQADAVVAAAKSQLGYKEGANNDTKYGIWYHLNNQPWCMMFVQWVFAEAAASSLIMKTAACQALEDWAKKNKLIVPAAQAQAGDIVLFDFTKSGKSEHTGIVTGPIDPHTHLLPTIEGNTGPDHVGVNQANGDGCYAKVRNPILVRAVIRPKWTA